MTSITAVKPAAEFRRLDVQVEGVETVLQVIGSGPPVLYLHGASTLEGFDFARDLADRFTVYCASHPNMGFSGDAPALADMQELVLHYLSLLDLLALPQRPHLLGFSMGGWLASELAGTAPDRFEKLVLVAPAGLADPAFAPTDLATIAPDAFPGYLAHRVEIATAFFPDGKDAAAAAAFGAARQREAAMVGRLCAAHGMRHPNLRRFLHRISNPALVLWGEQDRLLPAGQLSIWGQELPNAQTHLIADTGHLVMQEAPETLQTIARFLTP